MLLQRSFLNLVPSLGTGTGTGKAYFLPATWYGQPAIPSDMTLTDSQVRVQGTSAMNWSRPGYVGSSALTASAELGQEGIPMTPRVDEWKRKAGALRNISKTHLAVQFGWLPILAEIQAFAQRVTHQNAIVADAYKRARSNCIHVGYRFPTVSLPPTISTFTNTTPGNWETGALAIGESLAGSVATAMTVDSWFEGSWQSFLPGYGQDKDEEHLEESSAKARLLLGPFLSPKLIWELAPWSWAIDWMTNTEDILDAFSNVLNDGMVLRNAYIMCHFKSDVYAGYGPNASYKGTTRSVTPGSAHRVIETKRRFASVPFFGFGSVGELSVRQLSILAALGIAKS